MDPAVIEQPAAEPEPRAPWWRRPVVLGALILLLVTSSLLTLRSPSRSQNAEAARLAMEASMSARQVYGMRRNPLFGMDRSSLKRSQDELIATYRRLVHLDRTLRSARRLALLQYALEDDGWRETLASVREFPGSDTFKTEEELAFWADLLGARSLPPSKVAPFEKRIDSMELGWYRHLAREALYRKAGMRDRSERASASAQRPFNRSIVVGIVGFFVLLGGLGTGLLMAFYLAWARKNPHAVKPRLLELRPPPPLSRPKGESLYLVFLIYLVSYAVMQHGIGRLLGILLGGRLKDAPDSLVQLLSVVTVSAWLAVPIVALVKLAPRTGVTREDIGLRSRDILGDIVWGIGGWMTALPIALIVTLAATAIFKGLDSPAHPSVLELAASRDVLAILLMFAQASIIAPLSEELMFRGVFFRSLTPRMRWIPAVVVTSTVFAILHPQLPLGFFALFTLGATFNVLYALRGSLLPAIVAHALNNTVILIIVLLIFGG